ncbi:MAG: FtsX-like permease family protein [Candidatus Limnocylindrales bacterium]
MIRLGWRLAVAGGRSGATVTALTALAVAVGTAILLFALSFEPALATRYDHAAWRDTAGQLPLATADHGLMLARTDDHWQGQHLTRMDVAALSADAPVPPGLDRVPAAGQVYVSPALEQLMAANPADELGDRFGAITGTITAAGLMSPDELAVVVGRDPASLRAEGARVVTTLDGTGTIPMPRNDLIRILVVIAVIGALAPVAMLVATATRLSAARRERRLAALRLAGATPGQVTILAAIEALAATIPGALGGVLLFFAVRPLIAQVPLMQATWFPESIVPPLVPAVAMLALVPVVGVVAAVVALRRLNVSPLGVQRHERPGPLRRLRLLPLVASLAAFTAALLVAEANRSTSQPWLLWGLGGSFFAIIVGISIAGPWVTVVVGSIVARFARGPVGLLAGRRLLDDPRASFRAIGGVVMAVFIGSAYLAMATFVTSLAPTADQLAVRPDVLLATVPGDDAALADAAAARVGATTGVEAAAVLREIMVTPAGAADGTTITDFAVVADCRALISTLAADGLSCGPGLEHLGPGGKPLPRGTAMSMKYLGGMWSSSAPVHEVQLSIPADRVDRYAPEQAAPRSGGVLPAVIVEPAAVGVDLSAFPPTRVVVRTDGSPAAIERARTALEAAMPTSVVATVGEEVTDAGASVTELGRVVSLGVIVAMLIAGATLAIAVITGLLERRTPFALLRLTGMSVRRLEAVLLLEAAAPLGAVALLSAVLGTGVAQLLIRILVAGRPGIVVPGPDLGLVALLTAASAGALGVVAAALTLVPRITDTDATRFQ